MEHCEQCVAFKVPVSGVAWISENQWWPVQVRMIRAAEWWGLTCFRKSEPIEPLLYRMWPRVHIHSLGVTVFTHTFLLHQCNTLLWAMTSLFPVTALPNPPPLYFPLLAPDCPCCLQQVTWNPIYQRTPFLGDGLPCLFRLWTRSLHEHCKEHRTTCPLSQPECGRQVTPSPQLDCVNRELVIMKNNK